MPVQPVDDVLELSRALREAADRTGYSVRAPISWEAYLQLPDDGRGEYYGGQLVMAPAPGLRHQRVSARLMDMLRPAVPAEHEALAAAGWKPRDAEYIPDIMVIPAGASDEAAFTGMPLLVIEILSSNRSDDLDDKRVAYAELGLADYWIVDPRGNALMTHRLTESGTYALTGTYHHGTHPLGYADATVNIDLDTLLA